MADHIKTDLKNWFDGAKKTVLAGIGNPIRTDDYVGLKIIQDLISSSSKEELIWCHQERLQQ